jgi:hypothetical protein
VFFEDDMREADKRLTQLRPLYEWFQFHRENGGKIFPTFSSLQWFIRQHRTTLIDSQVLVPSRGNRCTLVTSEFGRVVYGLLFNPEATPDSLKPTNGCER